LLRVGRKMVSNIKKFGGGGNYIVGNSAKAYYAAAGEMDYFTKNFNADISQKITDLSVLSPILTFNLPLKLI
jgi:hypothetical protein